MIKWSGMHGEMKKTKGQKFGNPKLKMADGIRDVKTWINEANVDCEIYETMEKYGMINEHKKQPIPEELCEGINIGIDDRQTIIKKSDEANLEAMAQNEKVIKIQEKIQIENEVKNKIKVNEENKINNEEKK